MEPGVPTLEWVDVVSDFKVGDRVRDDRGHEGVVSTLPRVKVKFDSGGEMWLLPESCTKIEPPVKRGDPVTAENIDRLPNYTAVPRRTPRIFKLQRQMV